MVDLRNAKEAFENYLDGYERDNISEVQTKNCQNRKY